MFGIRRLVCLFLALVMAFSMVPTQAFALEAGEESTAPAEETAAREENNALTLSVTEGERTLLVGESCVLSAQEVTADALTWMSSDENVVSVDAFGRITAVAPGRAVITAVAPDGT